MRGLVVCAVAVVALADPMPLRHAVTGSTVQVGAGDVRALEFRRDYRYIGGHRFVLKGVADAEQHAFVDADASGNIRRFYWIQFEEYLPASGGVYDYDADERLTRDGREWHANVRRYSAPPDADSDRAQLYALFARAGLRAPAPAIRARLVHLTTADRRSELMIVYAEVSQTDVAPTAAETRAMIARAQSGFRIK